jgi:hypothetical protein
MTWVVQKLKKKKKKKKKAALENKRGYNLIERRSVIAGEGKHSRIGK